MLTMQLISERITPASCPSCKKTLDAFTGLGGVRPSGDDVTVCLYCQSVLQFNADLSLRYASVEAIEHVTLALSRMQNIVSDINRNEGR